MPIDTAQVETQVEILKSENIGLSVIKDLKLTEDPEFVGPGGGLVGRILGLLASPKLQSETALGREALGTFLANRAISRVGRTYVLDIGYTSLSAGRSSAVANAIADAYIVDQLEAKYQATRRASVWLQDRIRELRQQASDADRAVLDYKEKNNIVSVGQNSSANGGGPRLLGEQQIEELNTQLGSARAAAEESKARLERIADIMKKDVPDATVTDSLRNEVITRLRNNYLDMSAKEAIWSARYGSTHLAAVNLRTQMTELRRSILDELGRIAQSYKSDYEIAKARVEGLERNLQNLVANSQVINRDRLGLRDLESTAQVYHTLYDSFLQRYMEAIQQQSFPITEARLISAAAPPERKSGPKTFVILAIAGAVGFALSFGLALMREAVDRVFRGSRQVETELHTRCLAVLPRLVVSTDPTVAGRLPGDKSGRNKVIVRDGSATARNDETMSGSRAEAGVLPKVSQKAQLDLDRAFGGDRILERSMAKSRPFMCHVVEDPLSPFAEGFRGHQGCGGYRRMPRYVKVTSTVPGEGKSTVSANLAGLIAHAGKRVILLDGDLRNPTLTRAMAPHSKIGLLEVLNGQVALEKAIYIDEATGLSVLPMVISSGLRHNSSEILASDAFKTFVESLREDYDYVIFDFSPIAPVVDVRSTTQVIGLLHLCRRVGQDTGKSCPASAGEVSGALRSVAGSRTEQSGCSCSRTVRDVSLW